MLNRKTLSALLDFRRKRNWEQFHRPKELATALSIEACELLETFQWKTDEEVTRLLASDKRQKVLNEIADVAIVLSYLCHDLDIDLDAAVLSKIKINEAKYPVDRALGNSKKYDEY
jgi:NTP pyrophosphatase (non-canonical NTP hydrolase)